MCIRLSIGRFTIYTRVSIASSPALHCIATRSASKMIWTCVATQHIALHIQIILDVLLVTTQHRQRCYARSSAYCEPALSVFLDNFYLQCLKVKQWKVVERKYAILVNSQHEHELSWVITSTITERINILRRSCHNTYVCVSTFKPGSQYDTGAMSVTSITGKILLPKMLFVMSN